MVSRLFKAHSSLLVSNDFEDYAAVVARCYLRNCGTVMLCAKQIADDLNSRVDDVAIPRGFIEELYAPADEDHITATDRVLYTRANARRLDNYRRMLDCVPPCATGNAPGAALERGIGPREYGRRFQGLLQKPHHRCGAVRRKQ